MRTSVWSHSADSFGLRRCVLALLASLAVTAIGHSVVATYELIATLEISSVAPLTLAVWQRIATGWFNELVFTATGLPLYFGWSFLLALPALGLAVAIGRKRPLAARCVSGLGFVGFPILALGLFGGPLLLMSGLLSGLAFGVVMFPLLPRPQAPRAT